jgi:polyvinyl alcohol dehydrogenase (cytochrome)
MEWGSSSDGTRIYVAIANNNHIPDSFPTSGSSTAGSWAALDPTNNNPTHKSGAILWQTADPNGAIDIGPTSVANGVVYAGSMAGHAADPNMIAMDATNGKILWEFPAGYSVGAGASIVNGVVYWGSGYGHLGLGTGNSNTGTFYAFSINGN